MSSGQQYTGINFGNLVKPCRRKSRIALHRVLPSKRVAFHAHDQDNLSIEVS